MAQRLPCLICYRRISDAVNLLQPHHEDRQQALTRFFQFIGRHLDDSCRTDGQHGYGFGPTQFPIEEVIHAGLLTCADCSGIINSFCDLYHQMKSIELMLNWKVRALKNIMLCAQRAPARVSEFRTCVEKLEIGDISSDEIFDFKKGLTKKCEGILRTSLPELKLHKYKPDEHAAISVKGESSESFDGPENSQTQNMPLSESDDDEIDEGSFNDNVVTSPVIVDLNFPHLENKIVPINMDMADTAFEDFPSQSTGNEPLVSSMEIVQVREDRSQHIDGNPLSPQTMHEPEFETIDIKPDHNLITSIINGDYKTSILEHPAPVSQLAGEESSSSNTIARRRRHHQNSNCIDEANQSSKQVFRCRTCLKVFSQNAHLKRHFKTIHLQLREFPCELCERKFKRKDHLDQHRRGNQCRKRQIRDLEMELD